MSEIFNFNTGKTVSEPSRNIPVCAEADVVVVGGGPAGVAAAVSAGRRGCRVVLIERYGHLGGMATGGLVILIPHLSDGAEFQQLNGMNREWLDRLDKVGGALHPQDSELGSRDMKVVNKWQMYFSCVVNGRVRNSAYVDPELLKCVLSEMATEAGVGLALHSWGASALVEDGQVVGVTFESKSGRRAALGKVIIDATGDGDIFASAGAEFEASSDFELRNSMMALVFRLAGVDYLEHAAFKREKPGEWQRMTAEMKEIAGFRVLPLPSHRNDVVWVNNWIPGRNCLDFRDLTHVETRVREIMPRIKDYMKQNVPGFAHCFIMDTAQQIGTRGSRRIVGEYKVTIDDLKSGRRYDDAIAVIPSIDPGTVEPLIELPYRCLTPKKVNGLLAAGRCFSSDIQTNDLANLIPHCAAMGEAAGCAAALALDGNRELRDIDVKSLQKMLKNQGVYLR